MFDEWSLRVQKPATFFDKETERKHFTMMLDQEPGAILVRWMPG